MLQPILVIICCCCLCSLFVAVIVDNLARAQSVLSSLNKDKQADMVGNKDEIYNALIFPLTEMKLLYCFFF